MGEKKAKEEQATKKIKGKQITKVTGKDKVDKAKYLAFTKTGKVKKKPFTGRRRKWKKKESDKVETDSVVSESAASEDGDLESLEELSSQGIPSDDEIIDDLEEQTDSKPHESVNQENIKDNDGESALKK